MDFIRGSPIDIGDQEWIHCKGNRCGIVEIYLVGCLQIKVDHEMGRDPRGDDKPVPVFQLNRDFQGLDRIAVFINNVGDLNIVAAAVFHPDIRIPVIESHGSRHVGSCRDGRGREKLRHFSVLGEIDPCRKWKGGHFCPICFCQVQGQHIHGVAGKVAGSIGQTDDDVPFINGA